MSIDTWLLYTLTIFLVIMVPGPLSLYMINNAIHYGIRKSAPAIAGGTLASVLYLVASATGLGALLVASEQLFSGLKMLGALYLLYLGISTIYEALETRKALKPKDEIEATELPAPKKASTNQLFKKAFLLGASNPKDILFFMAFLPQFISSERPMLTQLFVIVATWIVVDLACKLFYGSTAKMIRPLLETPMNKIRFDQFTGGLFIVAGVSAVAFI